MAALPVRVGLPLTVARHRYVGDERQRKHGFPRAGPLAQAPDVDRLHKEPIPRTVARCCDLQRLSRVRLLFR